ncbi:hypothetical protein [Lysobacter gummosus]|uniref:hypothetical protein n=1 Tax=Lysobacter gummosus TaxID=262324 RepID=UPI003633E047
MREYCQAVCASRGHGACAGRSRGLTARQSHPKDSPFEKGGRGFAFALRFAQKANPRATGVHFETKLAPGARPFFKGGKFTCEDQKQTPGITARPSPPRRP